MPTAACGSPDADGDWRLPEVLHDDNPSNGFELVGGGFVLALHGFLWDWQGQDGVQARISGRRGNRCSRRIVAERFLK